MEKQEIDYIVIGAGFGGMASAALLAKHGFKVKLIEKNKILGGRAEYHEKDGFTIDYGPSWYLMPEVFEKFFRELGYDVKDLYDLQKLEPFYRVYFGQKDFVEIDQDFEKTKQVFESFETGGGESLEKYVKEATYKYEVAMNQFLYKEYKSIFQFFNFKLLREGLKLGVLESLDRYARKFFSSQKARQILEYAMVFLGNSPHNAPALYSILSHVDLKSGVFFPKGGIASLVKAFEKVLLDLGVEIIQEEAVTSIRVEKGFAQGVETDKGFHKAKHIISNADYAFTETTLLEEKYQSYKTKYWKKRVFAPTMFIIYLGLNKKLTTIPHHTMYFSPNWDEHFDTVFKTKEWPQDPCYYVSNASFDDVSVAPPGKENLFFLIPLAPGMEYDVTQENLFADKILKHFEEITGESITNNIEYKIIRSHKDFSKDYNSYLGTSLGLSHTLMQTAVFRPAMRSKKVKNLSYVGQYTHPGVGVPMTIIAAHILSEKLRGESRES